MKIGTRRTFIATHHEFACARAFGWQLDYRRRLPFSVRMGICTDWHIWQIGERRWITVARVK